MAARWRSQTTSTFQVTGVILKLNVVRRGAGRCWLREAAHAAGSRRARRAAGNRHQGNGTGLIPINRTEKRHKNCVILRSVSKLQVTKRHGGDYVRV